VTENFETSKVLARIIRRTRSKAETECWKWRGRHDEDGYALLDVRNFFGERETRVARLLFGIANSRPCDSDKQVDHKCNNVWCVNPLHVWEVTPFENNSILRRKRNGTLLEVEIDSKHGKDRCVNGHPWNAANRGISVSGNGYVSTYCRVCKREKSQQRRKSHA
jgi:hypothetical protein